MTPVLSDAELAPLLTLVHQQARFWWWRHWQQHDVTDNESAGLEALARYDPAKGSLATYVRICCASLMQDLPRQGLGGDPRTGIAATVFLQDAASGVDTRAPWHGVALRQLEAQCTPLERRYLWLCAVHGSQAQAARAVGRTEAAVSLALRTVKAAVQAGVL